MDSVLDAIQSQFVKQFATKDDMQKKALIYDAFQYENAKANKPITLNLFKLYIDDLIRNRHFNHCRKAIEFITEFNICYFQLKPVFGGGDDNWVLKEWCNRNREIAISKARAVRARDYSDRTALSLKEAEESRKRQRPPDADDDVVVTGSVNAIDAVAARIAAAEKSGDVIECI